MNLFYAPDIDQVQVLPEEESRHAVRVLRLKAGDAIELMDGAGCFYKAVITDPNPSKCAFEVTEKSVPISKNPAWLHIAIAPTKNIDRMEWFVEKCTEIGVDEITPILCRYSERKHLKIERLEKIAVAASKQSLRAFVPKINPLIALSDFLETATVEQLFIAHCYDEEKALLKEVYKPGKPSLILIGPEGDFSLKEVEQAAQKGFLPVSLGSSRLRTETAGIVACHTVALLKE